MINSQKLLTDLQSKKTSSTTIVKRLEDDLRKRCDEVAEVNAPLRDRYDKAKAKGRTAMTYKAWREEELTQVAVAWVLGCVFVRFLEDNELVEVPKLSGPGDRLWRARDEHELYFRRQPEDNTERGFLLEIFTEVGRLPAMREFFDRKHNPLWLAAPSGDACRELWQFWQKTDPETGALVHDFTDPDWNTRFLGDLYQDLSEAARKRFALLQTPDFVEEFILDRTLTPAIETFGYREVRMIDPTCGSGHFLLGAFARLFKIWRDECPGENTRMLAQNALNGVFGVDLNPFAVAIARFRLLLAALKVSGIRQLKNAPDFQIHLAVGDSLIHGARFDSEGKPYVIGRQDLFAGEEPAFKDELAHFFDTEDSTELHRILGQQYHAVVGNPPYITVKDKALNELYRKRYDACHRQYALSVPFMERFFDLALRGSGDGRKSAGFTGQITSNSFMKREFGKKLIEEHIPRWNLTHVVDTSGAFIPGHGTPTVIIFGRNAKSATATVRAVMGIKNEPTTPDDPITGMVWRAIIDQFDRPGSESEFVSTSDTDRKLLFKHPWALGGGGAIEAKQAIERVATELLISKIVDVGARLLTRLDDVYELPMHVSQRIGIEAEHDKPYALGENVRDWAVHPNSRLLFPYDESLYPQCSDSVRRLLWYWRPLLSNRVAFGKSQIERELPWFSFSMIFEGRMEKGLRLMFSDVATHNHFVLDRGSIPANSHAPVIKLPSAATENDFLQLLGLLNSTVACFWMQQVCHNKGRPGAESAGADEPFEQRFEFDATKLKKFPIPTGSPLTLARELDRLAKDLSEQSPDALAARDAVSATALAEAEQAAASLRARMISLQEELDWQCYRHYGLIEAGGDLEWPQDRLDELPPLRLGERTFEIRMARQIAAGELETVWFERHKRIGSKPITDLPAHWPGNYRALIERRLAFIEMNKNINLIERPEYKRRWNTEPWAKRQQAALRQWLLARLEGYFFEGSRVCDLEKIGEDWSDGVVESGSNGVEEQRPGSDGVEEQWSDGELEYGSSGEVESNPATLPTTPPLQYSTTPREASHSTPSLQYSNTPREASHSTTPREAPPAFSPAAHGFIAATRPHLVTANQLADVVASDKKFLEAAEVYEGASGFSVSKLVRALVESESVPYLPVHRYKESGLRKRQDWESTWELQRKEDEVEAEIKSQRSEGSGQKSAVEEEKLKVLIREAQRREVGEIPVPPKYGSADFLKTTYWALRGKLDVPKERWISYPGAERAGDDSLLIAWAGWDHLQQAQALAEYFLDAKDNQGWPVDRLKPLLAGLADLIPWLKQWHNEHNPDYGMGLGDYFAGFLEEQCRALSLTVDQADQARLEI